MQVFLNDNDKPRNSSIRVLATSIENFISFQKPMTSRLSARFIDSFRFLSQSLNSLASLLDKSKMMKHTRKFYTSDEEFEIASRKGVFCYEYISTMEKYEETKLPPRECFYSCLSGKHISDSEYAFAQKVWKTLKCRTLGDYSDQYLRIDCLLLADIFEEFRDTCFNIYQLDPAHCYSAPSLSFNAMLKTIKQPIPLITDYDMFLMFESGVRRGFCGVSERHARANNRYMGESFNREKTKVDMEVKSI